MSKDKKVELPQGYEVPKDMEAGGISSLPTENGSPAKAPPIRQKWSSPIQAMARIEQEMNGLDTRQKRTVINWFTDTYIELSPKDKP